MSLQSSWTLFVMIFACVVLGLVLAGDEMDYSQNKEIGDKRPFFIGSRYGRSSNQHRQVVARNDKFFLGSRYGKRSSGPVNDDGFPAIRITTPEVTCIYTGVLNLYKCFGNVTPAEPEE
uniref:CSON013511 protein n=1 Tax=Culicoides sonorensis TaxID=179676 RepID=A0A336LM74_CULSO